MFLIDHVDPKLFFKNGLPCDSACLNVQCYNNLATGLTYDTAQATCVINKYFDMHEVLRKNPRKWFNLKYGKYLLRTLYLLPCPRFPGLWHSHMPTSLLKSTYETLWKLEPDAFHNTCLNKFREPLDFTQASLEYYQLAAGMFMPRKANIGARFMCETDSKDSKSIRHAYEAAKYITGQKGKFAVLYDAEYTKEEFEERKLIINQAFQTILPEKSTYET